MSKFYHVVVEKDSEKKELLYKDLSKKELKKLFVKPFNRGKDIFINGVIHEISTIKKIQLIETDAKMDDELEAYKDESGKWIEKVNQGPGPVIFSLGYGWIETDIVDRGKDVTTRYINKAPSKSPNTFSKIIHNPWAVRIIGGIIVLFIAWLISNYFGLAL